MARGRRYLCGVPAEKCGGGILKTTKGIMASRAHVTSSEAFTCYVAHLLRLGYEQIGPRQFASPDGGPVRIISKRMKFGGVLRTGKSTQGQEADRYVSSKEMGGLVY